MAKIVLGMWTSHGPTLSTTPEQWLLRVPADYEYKHHFRNRIYDFKSLVALRAGEGLAEKSSLEARRERHAGCQRAIAAMADKFAEVNPDIAIIFGNDQRELFLEDITPSITVFTGEHTWDQPASEEQAKRIPPGVHEAEAGHRPPERRDYPAHAELAGHLAGALVDDGFDIAVSKRLPEPPGHWSSGVGHAFGFIYRQIMRDRVIPNVPIILNTFFPPNQPPPQRCFALGQAVGRALKTWKGGERVAIFGSGGMSHFVLDENFDAMFLEALAKRNAEALCAIDNNLLQSGTSELKTWIAASGVLFDTDLAGDVVGYEPCYRSEAGTGTANGFVAWS